jgi:hypothetical protein
MFARHGYPKNTFDSEKISMDLDQAYRPGVTKTKSSLGVCDLAWNIIIPLALEEKYRGCIHSLLMGVLQFY